MDLIPTSGSVADAAPFPRSSHELPAPKRSRAKLLTQVSRRTRLGKRIAELTAMFAAAVGAELTPMRKLKVDKAAQLTAIAELARGDFMRDGKERSTILCAVSARPTRPSGRSA